MSALQPVWENASITPKFLGENFFTRSLRWKTLLHS